MNLLTEIAPQSVRIEGQDYFFDADFRNVIKFEMLMEDSTIDEQTKGFLALNLFFEDIPTDIASAFDCILSLYSPEAETDNKKTGTGKQKRIYSFEHDSDYIYAAFLADYGIDLQETEYLHWWKFRALFKGLKPDNMICKIMEYRAADLSKLKGEEKKFYQRMQRQFALPISKSEQEKLDVVADFLMGGKE
ncbi:bacteriophage Gp15 family protein [Scatolibacter rhodanostii]|uniref:bacteriophage Gp15 family protein n=1 Tax=Scatolibacter rhodanostii TaxID=2014781 RepID=UPI000C07BE91|nr:bacteriophage Gp15 family protein [Scatolibacter rhodanostii]